MPTNFSDSIQTLQELSSHFESRRMRALQRLETNSKSGWFFGIIGLESEVSSFSFAEKWIVLEEVIEPPGEVELARALTQSALFSTVARYSHRVTHQLCIFESGDDSDQSRFSLAWWVISLIRVRSLAEFLVPIAADHSWSVITGVNPKTCSVRIVEDVPTAKKLAKSAPLKEADLAWVSEHLLKFIDLLEIENFRLAVECLTTHHQQTSDRMMVAMLWSGIESLFTIQTELTFRISAFIAALLEFPGEKRRDLYKRVKKLYGIRSKVVHGAKLTETQLHEHVVEVREILSRLLCLIVEKGKSFSEEQIENALFGVTDSTAPTA